MRLRALHGISATLIGLFLVTHIGNHIYGLSGQAAHQSYMTAARQVYRLPGVEIALILFLVWQVGSGLTMVIRGWKQRRGAVAWLQALSGLYLAFFIINHVGAVFYGRYGLGLDTDFRFAAAGFVVPPWPYFFAPYYFLGVFSLFTHIGCALYWLLQEQPMAVRRGFLAAALVIGAGLATAFVLELSGRLFPVDIPPAYKSTYGQA